MKKKILSLILAATLCFGASLTAFATESGTAGNENQQTTPKKAQSITEAENVEHTYVAYQIFKGDLSGTELVNVEWGSAASTELQKAILQYLTNSKITVVDDTAYQVAKAIQPHFPDSTEPGVGAELLANKIAEEIAKNPEYGKLAVTNKQIQGNETGWYLIVDTTDILIDEYAQYKDRAQLQNYFKDGELNIVQKRTVIEIDKSVKDVNDSDVTVDRGEWGESADYDVNDMVPFQIKSTTPSNLTDYRSFKYVIEDNQDPGLDAPDFEKIEVKVVDPTYGTKVLTYNVDYTVEAAALGDDNDPNDFKIVFENIRADEFKDVIGNKSEIYVSYESKLNEKAVAGKKGNENKARVTFKPNNSGDGETPWDIVIVFTFKPIINKVDGANNEALKGATFTLEKLEKGADGDEDNWTVIPKYTQTIDGTNLSTFEFKGIDDGYYRITEQAPEGYNAIKPIYFVVEATHTGKTLTKLTIKDLEGHLIGSSDKNDANINLGTFEIPEEMDKATATIINTKGVVLPSTGGIGTTIFYVVGGILVAAAVVLLVVRRRMRTEEE